MGAGTPDEQLFPMLLDRTRGKGMQLTGMGRLLQQLTKRVLKSALERDVTDHLGYGKDDPAETNSGNSRNGTRFKTVLTDVGPCSTDAIESVNARTAVAVEEPSGPVRGHGSQRLIAGCVGGWVGCCEC